MLTKSGSAGKILPGLRNKWATETENESIDASAKGLISLLNKWMIDFDLLLKIQDTRVQKNNPLLSKINLATFDFRTS
jgi:hypothetical protein